MKERTVSRRNLSGALLGGILGILALGYLHPAVLPLGCLLGVIVGWWYQEIWQSITNSLHQGISNTNRALIRMKDLVVTPTKRLREMKFNIGPLLKLLHFLVFILVWPFRSPVILIRALFKHQMNRAYFAKTLAGLLSIALNALWLVPLFIHWGNNWDSESSVTLLYFISAMCVGGVSILTPIFSMISDGRNKLEDMHFFYTTWDKYASNGFARFFVKNLFSQFLLQGKLYASLAVALLWFTGIGSAFLVLVIMPLSLLIGLTKGVYRVTTQSGHWLCFGTTLTVTALVAWIAYPYLQDPRILWVSALAAGLSSAVATEMLRRSIVLFFDNSERLEAIIIADMGELLAPSGRLFSRVTSSADDKFRRLMALPA